MQRAPALVRPQAAADRGVARVCAADSGRGAMARNTREAALKT